MQVRLSLRRRVRGLKIEIKHGRVRNSGRRKGEFRGIYPSGGRVKFISSLGFLSPRARSRARANVHSNRISRPTETTTCTGRMYM